MPAQIRLADENDAQAVAAIYAPYVRDTVISFELEPPSAAEMRARMRTVLLDLPWLMCEHDGEALGYAYAGKHRDRPAYQWSADVSVYIRRDLHRQGIGRALYTSLFALLKLQGYYSLFAGVTLPNEASVGLHRALGFELIGVYRSAGHKMGSWHDVAWFGMALRPHTESPAPLNSLADIMTAAHGYSALAAGLPFLSSAFNR